MTPTFNQGYGVVDVVGCGTCDEAEELGDTHPVHHGFPDHYSHAGWPAAALLVPAGTKPYLVHQAPVMSLLGVRIGTADRADAVVSNIDM